MSIDSGWLAMRGKLERLVLALLTCLAGPAQAADELLVGVSRTNMVLPLYLAEDQGLFRQAGVAVRLIDCGSGKRCLQEMAEGRLHLALAADVPLALAMAQRQPVAVLASVAWSTRDNLLIVRRSSGIREVRDLAGKRVGVVTGTGAHYQLESALLLGSTDPRRLTLVDLPPPALVQALDSGRLQAVSLWQPWAHQLLRHLGADALVLQPLQPLLSHYNLVSRSALLATRRADLERLLRALAAAVDVIRDHPPQAQDVLMRRLEVDADYVQATWQDFGYGLTLNQQLVTTLEGQRRWAVRERYVSADSEVNMLDHIESSLLQRVRPQGVTLLR
ncbi:MAG: hypothetical protein RIQ60_1821 [Pseudomonadota bacterium]|jgi:NitT/TauT family transport system substrate-binding protein